MFAKKIELATTTGYHITDVIKVKDIQKYLDAINERKLTITQVLYTGVVVQIIYKV